MPRRPRRRPEPAPLRIGHSDSIEVRSGQSWNVRRLRGGDKSYKCPSCHRPIPPGTAHLLIWPVEKPLLSEAIDERRHWHTPCWARG